MNVREDMRFQQNTYPSFSCLCVYFLKIVFELKIVLRLNELKLFVDFKSEDRLFHIFASK